MPAGSVVVGLTADAVVGVVERFVDESSNVDASGTVDVQAPCLGHADQAGESKLCQVL
jgi:hypothetical protein